jgi:hypothetical protein
MFIKYKYKNIEINVREYNMSTIDYNVDNYTITELLAILGLDDPTVSQIIDSTNNYIAKFTRDKQPQLSLFFQEIQGKLVRYMNDLETSGKDVEYDPNEKQTNNWFKHEALPQSSSVQKDKITDRVQKIDVYDNHHVPMNREQLGINNNYKVDVAQDTLNPNLENTTSRFINIDSQFRQASGGSDSMSTDFTLDLSDPLTNVLNLRLYSFQIPFTWYAIDYSYGNTCFWVTNAGQTFQINLEPGNYNSTDFCNAIQTAFTSIGFTNTIVPTPQIITYNANNAKITFKLDGWKDPSGIPIIGISQYNEPFDSNANPYFTFFDATGQKTCYTDGSGTCGNSVKGQTFDGTLGWLMGFRLPVVPVFTGGNTPNNVINLHGSKYFILVIDDYNQNHINNGLITITELSKVISMPNYYSTNQPQICSSNVANFPQIFNPTVSGELANISPETAFALGINPNTFINSIQDKLNVSANSVPQILPSAPRTLTQAQIYTINEIIKNRNKTISFREKAPTNSDTFALLPIKYSGLKTGDIYVDFSGSLQDNKRIYFGPVNIDRLHIRLLDDRGNTIDLHGGEWCITLISDNLYQY